MPVTVKFDPTVNSLQAQVISDATPFNDGVMSKAQAAKLANLSPGGFSPGGYRQVASVAGSLHHPKPEDGVRVHYRRMGVSQEYTMQGTTTLLDASRASAQITLALVAEGQILLDLVERA